MRATRGLLASLGASTALVLAAAAALFSVSTIVAFRGWPGVDAALPLAGGDRITVASSTDPGMTLASQSGRIVVPEVGTERRREAAAPRVTPVEASTATSVVSRPRAAVRRRIPDSVNSPTNNHTGPTASVPAPRASDPPAAGDDVRQVGSGISGTVGGVTGGLGDTVRPVSPALGRTLDEAGRSLEQTIGGLTEALGTTVDALTTGTPPR
jgi:hypothetical protein